MLGGWDQNGVYEKIGAAAIESCDTYPNGENTEIDQNPFGARDFSMCLLECCRGS